MKAFLNRLNRGLTKDKDRDKDVLQKEKIPQLPPLRDWPPQRATSTPTTISSFKPLPDLSGRPLPPSTSPARLQPTLLAPQLQSRQYLPSPHPTPRRILQSRKCSRRAAANGSSGANFGNSDAQKKVAFLSPPPTPTPPLDRPLPGAETPTPANGAPAKSTVSRFHAAHTKDTRGSTSTAASSRTDVASTLKSNNKAASTRTTTSPYPGKQYGDGASLHQSLRSGTPYSQMSNASSRILAAQSWSEGAEEDLVSNLGQRERTRQEVLWEIVASEERYVNHLPIAARFLSPLGFRSDSPTGQVSIAPTKKEDNHPNIDGESMNSEEEDEADDRLGAGFSSSRQKTGAMSQAAKHNHPRSPYGSTAMRTGAGKSVPFPSRSHQSLPPPPRMNLMTSSTQSLGRQSFFPERDSKETTTSRVLRTLKQKPPTTDAIVNGAVPPNQIPEDLRKCLEVIEGGILEGHVRLSEGLRKRYEEQYPLVRSLADVFVSNSHILHGYATYVLHLERALEQVDNALSTASATKKPKKQDADQWMKICQYLQRLEIIASEKGETGLAISLSKPFQRLLKYPLLFQNLLFHTDPSTFEYESTLQMVAEVETIVRSIEDEKIQKEERDKTRDVFARIEGLDKVKQLMVPKPSRVLMEERPVMGVNPLTDPSAKPSSTPPVASQNPKGVKGKTSFKRLSDVLQAGSNGIGSKKDLWLVVFNDVVLRCQRTGTTSLPLVAATNSRTNSLPELQGKAKYATTGRRSTHTKPRNMYKFIKIETWAIGDVVQPREGVVSMEDVVRSRQQVHSGVQPRIVPMPEDEDRGVESDDSDRKSKMSFSYWGADKVTLQKPIIKPRQLTGNGVRRGGATTPTAYARESSANAKFGTRLVSGDSASGGRPASRRTQATPVNRRPPAHSDEGHSTVKATVTRGERPAWDGSTRSPPPASTTPVPKRTRNISQTSAATRTTVATKSLASPAPSEDSGVGFYRQIIAQDPSLNA
ncbi:hypothetical protein A0H81_04173 [Grifola frondosa]|uniref:DH domain-containing protein n=1 Tax=Grifola frondosa TaxID=5627 RepID=A0A1C7MG75_GRIFR|nr:hypothetical protein A0H81_04173 [Grifola frondosa]